MKFFVVLVCVIMTMEKSARSLFVVNDGIIHYSFNQSTLAFDLMIRLCQDFLEREAVNLNEGTVKNSLLTPSEEADYLKRTTGIRLPPNYNKFDLPKSSDGTPMPVFVLINISKIIDWDELNDAFTLDLRMRIMWADYKILEFNNNTHRGDGKPLIEHMTNNEVQQVRKVNNDPSMLSLIWKPNLFIEKLLEVHQPVLMTKPVKVRYIPDLGWFEYITRIQIKISCSMNFQYYPADTQVCTVPIRSYTYLKNNINLSWYKKGVVLTDLEVSSFDARIDDVKHYFLQKSDDPNEIHEVVGFSIYARRRLSYHIIQTYIASSFYIIITTLCFLLPSTMIEARIGMSMTTLLTLTAMFGSVRESTPIVSYTKAIDIWMVGCIFFVFLTLFQFTFSTWLKHVKNARKVSQPLKGIKNQGFEMGSKYEVAETDGIDGIDVGFSPETLEKYGKLSAYLEAYSFPLFFGIFIVYSAIYWIWLITASDYYNWNVNSTWNTN